MNKQEVSQFIKECKQGLDRERLHRLLAYDKQTGEFTRLISTARRVKVGEKAGSLSTNGYLYICLPDKKYLAHRLAWFYEFGEMPKEIDHINGKRTDNRIENLRSVTRSENTQNQWALRSDSTTGVRGVTKDKRRNKFRAQVAVNGVNHYLGDYNTISEAADAAKRGMVMLHTHNESVRQQERG